MRIEVLLMLRTAWLLTFAAVAIFAQDDNLANHQQRWKRSFDTPAKHPDFQMTFGVKPKQQKPEALLGAAGKIVARHSPVDRPCAILLRRMTITEPGAARIIRPDIEGMAMPRAAVPAPPCIETVE
jgi:hypothetical protein